MSLEYLITFPIKKKKKKKKVDMKNLLFFPRDDYNIMLTP